MLLGATSGMHNVQLCADGGVSERERDQAGSVLAKGKEGREAKQGQGREKTKGKKWSEGGGRKRRKGKERKGKSSEGKAREGI
jgi:hypothetical protein